MTSLATDLTTTPTHPFATATFKGKANIQDITNPVAPISVDGNATLQVQMTDKGEPGRDDTIAITGLEQERRPLVLEQLERDQDHRAITRRR